MPDDYRISDLTTIGTVGNDDLVEVSAVNGASETGFSSFKMPMTKLGDKVVNGIQYASDLQTTSKTIVGAINELAQGGNVGSLDDLDDVDISSPENEQVLKYNSASRKWVNGQGIEIIKSASGNPCSFETRFPGKLKSLLCNIVAKGGGGTPQQENPIVGYSEVNFTRCGKNLLPPYTLSNGGGITITSNNGTYIISGTTTAYYQIIADTSFILKAGTYTLKNNGNVDNNLVVQLRSVDGLTTYASSSINSDTFTINADTEVKFRMTFNNGGSYSATISPQLELGSTATEYEPYNGQTITLALGQTVYGGRLYFENGWKCEVTHGIYDLGDVNWYREQAGGYYRFRASGYTPIPDAKTTGGADESIICSCFVESPLPSSYNTLDNAICVYNGMPIARCDAYTDAADFKTAMSGQKVTFTLATPFTIDLSSSDMLDAVAGKNNVFSDCGGDVEVEYYTDIAADIKEFIKDNIEITDIVKELVDTLEAGETTLTFTDPAITTNSTIKVYENVGAFSDIVMYSDIVVTTGQIVITFPVQSTDLQVKVRIS